MSGIGLVFNPRAGANRRDPTAAARLARRLGDKGVVAMPRSLDELSRAAEDFRRQKIDVLGIAGGDGTNYVTLTHFHQVYGAEPLPTVAFLRGGTMNTVANSLNLPQGRPDSLLDRLVRRYLETPRLTALEQRMLDVNGKLGFLWGLGVIPAYLREYYNTGAPSPWTAAKTLARGIGSTLINGQMIQRMRRPVEAEVLLSNGEVWPMQPYLCVGAGTIADIGLGFKPYYLAGRTPGTFHMQGIMCSPLGFVLDLPRIHSASPMRDGKSIDRATDGAVVRVREGSIAYMIDGDLLEHPGSEMTVRAGRSVAAQPPPDHDRWSGGGVEVTFGDSASCYARWEAPDVIVSDGAYGVLGFEGDTSDHLDLPAWYEPHIEAWSKKAKASTTLWFWNSEIGWAAAHPLLERYGWRYVNANIWNKGMGHVAGNVHTAKIRRFPVVSEVCVHYVREVRLGGLPLKAWLLREWRRTGLPLREANRACGVADAATRKYLTQDHLWYWPPVEMFARLRDHANTHGDPAGRPYFSADGVAPLTDAGWAATRSLFRCPHGVTNVWDRPPLHGPERVTTPAGRAVHLNQKPLDLLQRLLDASSDPGSVVWEPFGGLFSTCVAALRSGRRAFAAEIDPTYYQYGVRRLTGEAR